MYQIDFTTPIHIHFIGIGGISMSGLAEILLEEGFTITGSDSKESPLTRHLEEKGARIYYGQKASNIEAEPGIQVVVYTAAIHPDNPEFKAAKDKNIPMLTRAELLGELMRNYKESVAVSGTHGKTTTTSMITDILLAADNRPYHFRRRYFKRHRRQHPCRRTGPVCNRSLRVHQQLLILLSNHRSDLEH